MQIRFGVLGDAGHADEVFDRLVGFSVDSNPGIDADFERGGGFRLGRVARSMASWKEPRTGRWFHLDGQIRFIDGRRTSEHGLGETDFHRLGDLYETYSDAMWERLDGSFCLIVVDGHKYRMGVDVAGTRGVYWWSMDGLLVFHSHLIDLAPTYPGSLNEDPGALGNYLVVGRYPASTTAFRQIGHMGAGQCLSFVDGQVSTRNHFEFVSTPSMPEKPREALIDELTDLVTQAVAVSWQDARHPVVPLSGGMDSRYLAAELTRQNGPVARTITWGEDPTRPGSDAMIASRVAATLRLEHTWLEKTQRHTPETFKRAIYLSSGEGDCAIHYPGDHLLHADLAVKNEFGSLFRGDELFGTTSGLAILTTGGAIGQSSIVRLAKDHGYEGLVDQARLELMGSEQATVVDEVKKELRSATPQSQRMEIMYGREFRRELAIYNAVKNADLEVHLPFYDRRLVEWLKGIPDSTTPGRVLERAALFRRFPELAQIPFASSSNLPDWESRSRSDPSYATFLFEWLSEPGWVDSMGTKSAVLAALDRLRGSPDFSQRGARGRRLRRTFIERARTTVPGRLLREMTLERRYPRNSLPPYVRLARLAVLHGMLGQIETRRTNVPTSRPNEHPN